MAERAAGEFLDQAFSAAYSTYYHVRKAAMLAIGKFMRHSEGNAFLVCRWVEGWEHSEKEPEQILYDMVKEEVK
jgi:hypothetical protein